MPGIDRPPVSPQVQAQMGPPGGPNFGPGIGQAQQAAQNPIDLAVSTIEKIAMGVQNDAFRPYADKAIAILKVGAAVANRQGPQSQPGIAKPPSEVGAPPPQPQLPPMPGQMPG